MEGESDDFGLDNTDDLEIDVSDSCEDMPISVPADLVTLHRSTRTILDYQQSNRAGSSGLFSGDDDDFDGESADLVPRQVPPPPPLRPAPPVPPRRRGSSGLFSEDDGTDGEYGLGFSAADDLGAEINHDGAPSARQLLPPVGNYTDPSLSLDANDSEIADLLGPQSKAGAPASALQAALPPRPGPARTVTAPPPPPAPEAGSYGLEAEDSELADLLADSPREAPPRPSLGAGSSSSRRISFKEPVVAVAAAPPPRPRMAHPQPMRQPDSDSFGNSSDGYGLERDSRRDLATQPARRDGLSDDFASGEDYGEVTFGGRVPSPAHAPDPSSGASFKRILAPENPIQDPLDSPVARHGRPPPRGIPPRRQVAESSEAYMDYDDDYGDDDVENDVYGNRGDVRAGHHGGSSSVTFRRIPSPTQRGLLPPRPAAPSPPGDDEYEEQFEDDEDMFADDASWDGEIRFSAGGAPGRGSRHMVAAARPSSARQPRSRGPHATGGTRLRSTSALPPRERQAAMIEDMMGRHPSTWDIREVATWVEFIGLGQYRSKFVHHPVDGGLLLSLGDEELARDLRILPLGHRRALLAAIAQLREAAEALEQQRGGADGAAGAGGRPKSEAERLADLRRRAAEQQGGVRRPSSAGARLIPPEPFLGPAAGKITVYEQRAKLLYQLDRARHRAAQHAAIIEQLSNNKALTEAQMAEMRGKLKDLETKHKEEFAASHRRGMTAPISPGSFRKGAEYGTDAAVPWLPVGRGTQLANRHPERFARDGEDAVVDLTFRPRVVRLEEVPAGAVRDIVAKALSSRTPFWQRMEFEFEKMRKEREAREEARRKRRERMGMVRRGGGGEGEDEEQAKSPHWNNYWVPNSNKNTSYHKHFKRGSENEELNQYRSFAKDKMRLSRWFVEDDESTEGDVALERLVNRMIRALVRTKAEVDSEVGDTFDKRIRNYFEQHGYKFQTHTSNTIMVRARGTRPPAPPRPDTTMYDFEEVEQYYPDYLKKKTQGAGDNYGGGDDDDGDDEARMVPKRTTWKRLVAVYYMERQKKIRAAIAMVKMSQFVQRNGVRWPPERDRDTGKKDVWVPSSTAGALHQLDGRDRTFNEVGRDNISLHAKLKKALGPPQPVTFQMKVKEQEEKEAKAEALFALMGWPHSSGDPHMGPPMEPLLLPAGEGDAGFGLLAAEQGGGERRRWQPQLDFFSALDALIDRALELRHLQEEWVASWHRARERGYGEEDLPLEPPRAEELSWGSDDPLVEMQNRAMERQRQEWLLEWERDRRRRERQAAQMLSQGYRQEDIDYRLGPQPEASEVEFAVENHLMLHVELLARLKEGFLLKFRGELKGTKKMMAVYRALRSQMFLDETRARQQRREDNLRAMYESFRRGSRRIISTEEQEAAFARMKDDEERREARRRELLESKRLEEEASLTPWYLQPRHTSSRGPSQPTSRTTSPSRRSTRSPPAASTGTVTPTTPRRRASSATRTRGTSGGGGPLEGEGSSRSKYIFGSSTPKSIWNPMGYAPRPARPIVSMSLLDSPGLLQGGQSAASLDQPRQQQRTTPRSGSGAGAGVAARQRPSTPTRSSPRTGSAGGGPRSPAPPQRPRSAPAPPASPSRPSGGGAISAAGRRPTSTAPPPSSLRSSAGGAGGASNGKGGASGAPGQRLTAATVSPSPRSLGTPASPGRGRGRSPAVAAPPASPRRSTGRVVFATPSSPTRSSGGGSLAARGRAGTGAAGRRGLMDGDTTSGTPSPERRTTGPAGAGPGSAAASAAAALLQRQQQRRRGLADSDSSPSPQASARRPPLEGGIGPNSSSARGPSGSEAAISRQPRSVGDGGMEPGTAVAAAADGPSRATAGSVVPARSPLRQTSATQSLGATTRPQGLSQQSSATGSLGLPAERGGDGGRGADGTGLSGPAATTAGLITEAARLASSSLTMGPAAGSVGAAAGGDSVSSSRRPSTPPPPAIQQESSSTSKTSSISASGRPGGSSNGGVGVGAPGRSSGAGGTPPKSPLSRSPLAGSPPSQSPPSHSPPSQSPPAPMSPRSAPSPQSSHRQLPVVEAEATEGSAGLGNEDTYALDEYVMDAEEGEELDYGEEVDAAEDF
ncbi:hypothetical protein VOLCADRAFT_108397 [Volvox carteri f. nagariensis]|uniref:SAM domain-containing protein n=1 Tax=Volvox carteri f. nagariensis TaxID=3068 RepID=D8UJY1_VOLCA|nr:uncharacterized protein VOLCADRAFT_108397 [Volvox carteri f. nagariensis]EFJ39973.1 hypothetical protein VOLCADRAFT_108397 [Volvox carteri f. nagariensis]|eukprot:XP_002958968.1 hypothetical protein VOLCADRAFT_108397 [Volvox carteri f. nagariensis]